MGDAAINSSMVKHEPKYVQITLTNRVTQPRVESNLLRQTEDDSNNNEKLELSKAERHEDIVSCSKDEQKQKSVEKESQCRTEVSAHTVISAVPHTRTQTQVSRPDILEQMKRQISRTFANYGRQRQAENIEAKTTLMPGTNSEYRTPGAINLNKKGRVKRPMNAFMVWAREIRGQLAAAMPHATNSDISIKLGDLWKKLPDDQKQRYYKMAEMIKQKHRQDYPDWVYRPSPVIKRRDDDPAAVSSTQLPDDSNPQSRLHSGNTTQANNPNIEGNKLTFTPQRFIPRTDFRPSLPGNYFLSNSTQQRLANRISQQSNVTHTPTGVRCAPINDLQMLPGQHVQLLTVNNNAIIHTPEQGKAINGSGTFNLTLPVTARPDTYVQNMTRSIPLVVPIAAPICIESQLLANQSNQQTSGTFLRQIRPNLQHTSVSMPQKVLPLVQVPMAVSCQSAQPITTVQNMRSGTVKEPLTLTSVEQHPTKPAKMRNMHVTVPSDTSATRTAVSHKQTREQNSGKSCGGSRDRSSRESHDSDEDLQLDVDAFLSRIQNDDLWPFPFSELPSDDWLQERPSRPLYTELLTSHDPFLSCDYLYSEVYPGCLHLDMEKWEKFLSEEEIVDLSEPSPDSTKQDTDDFTVSPVPLKETLAKSLGALVETNDTGDIIVGNLVGDGTLSDARSEADCVIATYEECGENNISSADPCLWQLFGDQALGSDIVCNGVECFDVNEAACLQTQTEQMTNGLDFDNFDLGACYNANNVVMDEYRLPDDYCFCENRQEESVSNNTVPSKTTWTTLSSEHPDVSENTPRFDLQDFSGSHEMLPSSQEEKLDSIIHKKLYNETYEDTLYKTKENLFATSHQATSPKQSIKGSRDQRNLFELFDKIQPLKHQRNIGTDESGTDSNESSGTLELIRNQTDAENKIPAEMGEPSTRNISFTPQFTGNVEASKINFKKLFASTFTARNNK